MIPHHQGAIEMARLELLYGRDPRLRRLAQGVVVEQAQEITLMRSILASPPTMMKVLPRKTSGSAIGFGSQKSY